jgi:carbon monoxide dehydrogenase subunit G
MAIRTEKTFEVQEPLERVWKFISDPQKVMNCLPGAQITEALPMILSAARESVVGSVRRIFKCPGQS